MPLSKEQVGDFVLQTLRRRGLEQQDLAAAVGIHKSVLSRRLRGIGRPLHQGELERIARFLKLHSASELLELAEREFDRGIPLIGTVPGGALSVHWQQWDDIEACETWLDRSPGQTERSLFAVRLVGNSMAPRFPAGCVLICKPIPIDAQRITIENRMVVVTLEDGDASNPGATTVGFWRVRSDGQVVLQKENAGLFGPLELTLDRIGSVSTVEEVRFERPLAGPLPSVE